MTERALSSGGFSGAEEIGEARSLTGAEEAGSLFLSVGHVGCCSSREDGRLLEPDL